MKKILILGTGNAQTDFIMYCKENGFEVHTCSYRNEGRGIQHSDYFNILNISDVENVEVYARNHNINLVYSTGSDLAMPTVSKVSENLSLPTFISSKIAKICSNKHLLRKELMNFKEYSIPYKLVKTIRDFDNWECFPAIVKPDDSQGQRGITLAEKTSDFQKAFSRAIHHSNSNTVIVEEFIDGFEISVNTYVVNGIPRLLFLTERISFAEYSGGIIKSHKYPITKYVDENKIYNLISTVLKLLKIENGPVYFQIKINGKGNPKIIEITPRLDGCHLWRLIYSVRGINLFEIIVNHLLTGKLEGNPFQDLNVNKKIDCATLDFFTQAPGSVMNKNNHKIDKDASYLEWYYNEGEDILPINGFSEKVGYQIKLGK